MNRLLSQLTGLLLIQLVFTCSLRAAQNSPPVQYTVSFADADRHLVDVSATIPTAGKSSVELMMPVWTPGSYLVREYSRNIETISAFDAANSQVLEIAKSAKNRWTVQVPKGSDAIRVDYRLYCREMSVRTNWVEHDFGVLVGAATFVTGVDLLENAHQVRFILPTQWRQVISSMPSLNDNPTAFAAPSFDVLVDSPIVLGNPKVTSFTVSEKEHLLVTLNDGGLWDNEKAAADVQRIVETQHEFWGTVPYDRYVFFNVVGESGGGLEHDNGTLLMTSRWTYGNPERYLAWLGLVSHEFFHTWNVRRLRPKVLRSYNYEQENYFNELWIAEGVTSYFDDLLQVQSGLLSESDYYKRLSRTLQSVESAPGNVVQPLADSSYDAWIKFYRPDENDINARVNYYTKGSLVALVLDAKIRKATSNKKSLRDVMQLMYERYSLEKGGYDLQDFRKAVDEVSGQPLGTWLSSVIDDTDPLDYQAALELYGLQLGEADKADDTDGSEVSETVSSTDAEKDSEEKSEAKKDEQPKVKLADAATAKKAKTPYIGATVRDQAGKMVVTQVLRGGPADLAGWNVDDELLALGDFRASESLLGDNLSQFDVGSPIQSLLSRRGQLVERSITLQPHQGDRWKLSSVKKPSDQQKESRKQWLNQPN